SQRLAPPSRADPVASLMRPPEQLGARKPYDAGEISADQLRTVEDDAVREAVRKQGAVGLQTATDGEFRRGSWHMDFINQLGGATRSDEQLQVEFRDAEGVKEFCPDAM